MSDLEKQAEGLGAELEVRWTDASVDEALARLHARRRRRSWAARATIVTMVLTFGVVALMLTSGRAPLHEVALPSNAPPLPTPRLTASVGSGAAATTPLILGDGSVVEMLGPDTRLETSEVSPGAITIRLRSGSARFRVVHRPSRVFRVAAGDVSIIDLGTEFAVTRSGDSSLVEVLEGRVRVEWQGGVAELVAGERRVFPPADAAPKARVSTAATPTDPPRSDDAPDVEALLASADEARLRGDAAAAVAPLRRVVDEHADDPRAALAAFTLGRVYLDELHDEAQAATAFARARALAGDGPLAEDALAREVEALTRAGHPDAARGRAQEYLDRYPGGHRAREMRRSAELP